MIKKSKEKIDTKKIQIEISDLRKSLMNLNFQKTSGQLEKTSEIKKTKRKIAQLKTLITKNSGELNA